MNTIQDFLRLFILKPLSTTEIKQLTSNVEIDLDYVLVRLMNKNYLIWNKKTYSYELTEFGKNRLSQSYLDMSIPDRINMTGGI